MKKERKENKRERIIHTYSPFYFLQINISQSTPPFILIILIINIHFIHHVRVSFSSNENWNKLFFTINIKHSSCLLSLQINIQMNYNMNLLLNNKYLSHIQSNSREWFNVSQSFFIILFLIHPSIISLYSHSQSCLSMYSLQLSQSHHSHNPYRSFTKEIIHFTSHLWFSKNVSKERTHCGSSIE